MVNRLLLLNGIAIINVILFHATGFGFTAMFSWAHRYRPVTSPNYDAIGTAAYYAMRAIEQYAAFTIPTFLFVSGFFISVLAGRTRGVSAGAVTARIRALAVPYLLWSALILAALAAEGRLYSGSRYLRMVLTGATNPNYYYVPLLMQFYALAPAIAWAARRWWQALLAATALLQVGVYLLQYVVVLNVDHPVARQAAAAFPKWWFASHLFWFTLGVVVGFEQQAFKEWVRRRRWPLALTAAGLFLAGLVEWEVLLAFSGSPWVENRQTLIDGLYAGAVVLAFLGFAEVTLPFTPALVDLGVKSFGIYLVHGIAMEYAARAIYHAAPWMLGRQALFLPVVIAVGLAAPLLLMAVVSRSRARGLYPYFFG